ncbi:MULTISPECIES: hypothetical protein [Streptomycetaceae]|uniref:hypothetical protein n=1 Tax=Streptomycetaceae TaxID=2062 RepID=UPI000A5E8112|nr:hypothetical protein [Streptomyces sp. CB02056]
MSVLSVPRVFFRGQMTFNPATMNNNGLFPTYDFRTAELNWNYLKDKKITPDNFREAFPKWAFSMQTGQGPDGKETEEPPSGWSAYGGNDWWLHVQPRDAPDGKGVLTTVTGGQTAYGADPSIPGDPLLGAVVNLAGDSFPIADLTPEEQAGDGHFPRAAFHTSASMADNNPDSVWSPCFFARRIQIGSRTSPEGFFYGDIEDGLQLPARWQNFSRNLNLKGDVYRDGVGATVVQACVGRDNLHFTSDKSPLLNALKKEMDSQKARGIMMRYSVYLTHYFNALEFAGCKTQKERFEKLLDLWEQDRKAGNPPRRNTCLSRVVGTIGLWHESEPASVPGGRFLAPANSVKVLDSEKNPVDAWFGPAVAEVNRNAGGTRYVSLDLGATIPEKDASGDKETSFGTLELVVAGAATIETVAEIKPDVYDRSGYELTSGIIDVPVDGKVTDADLADGVLGIRCKPNAEQVTMLTEKVLTAQTELRSIYVDQSDKDRVVVVEVRDRGAIPTRKVGLVVQQYLPDPPPPMQNGSFWKKPEKKEEEVLTITKVGPVVNGRAEIGFTVVSGLEAPNLPVIAFFPYYLDGSPDVPPERVGFVGAPWSFVSAFYCCVRMLPFDDQLPEDFRKYCEEHHNDPVAAWDYVYKRVLYVYDMIFPVMKYYAALDLGDRTAVERNIDQILELSSVSMANSSLYMPVTRDLSSGKRKVLEMYRTLLRTGKPKEVTS